MKTRKQDFRSAGIRRWLLDGLLTMIGIPVLAAAYAIVRAYRTYHPPRLPFRKRPEDFGLSPTPVRIPTANSQISLDAWLFVAEHAAPTVIVGHGVGQHKGFTLPYIHLLYSAGYNVLAFDHRNHGHSDPDRVFWHMSKRFTDDMEAAITFARRQPHSAGLPVALLTFSFSTFPAVYVLQRPACQVEAIICDSGPALDLKSLPERFLAAAQITLPRLLKGPILYRALNATYQWAVNTMLAVAWPPDLSTFKGKLLLIANEEDTIIPPDEVKIVADLCPRAEFWLARGASHLMALRRRKQEYSALVLEFLTRAFAEHSARQENISSDITLTDSAITPDWSLP